MALTDKYVTEAGSGAANGSVGNPMAWTAMVTQINAGGTAGNRYNVSGPISRGATDTISGSGTATSPVVIRGYLTTIGDGYQGRTNGNGPLITTHMPAIAYDSTFRLAVSGTFLNFESLKLTGTRSGEVVSITGADIAITRCIVENASTNAAAVGVNVGGARVVVFSNDCSLTGGSGGASALTVSGNGCRAVANRINGGGAIGITCSAFSAIVDNLIYGCGGIGISMNSTAGAPFIYGNTAADGSSDGIDIITGTTGLQCIINNLLTDNGGYGIDGVSAANAIFAANNRMDRNTSGATNLATDWLSATSYNHELTSVLKAAEYTDAAARDYRLVSTSPAKGTGMFAHRDIGALQRAEAGGGGNLINGGLLSTR